ncbi:hypothetical protein BJY59DRAFT_553651 [Rhodotorula toruloides]
MRMAKAQSSQAQATGGRSGGIVAADADLRIDRETATLCSFTTSAGLLCSLENAFVDRTVPPTSRASRINRPTSSRPPLASPPHLDLSALHAADRHPTPCATPCERPDRLPAGPDMQDYDSIIIGGGPAGLTALKTLTENGFECILFEAESDVGGTFKYRSYENAELVSSKQLTAFSDFRFPPDQSDHVSLPQYVEYLKRYWTCCRGPARRRGRHEAVPLQIPNHLHGFARHASSPAHPRHRKRHVEPEQAGDPFVRVQEA